ncbi:MAG: EVE domain-containing protein [Ilumatobacteraceae bacterium]
MSNVDRADAPSAVDVDLAELRVAVVGAGRMGRALLAAVPAWHGPFGRGFDGADGADGTDGAHGAHGFDVVLLAVPDDQIGRAAACVRPGPMLGHTAGSLGLSVLAPHHECFAVHPLMTVPAEGADFRGAGGAIAGSTDRALGVAAPIAATLGLVALEIADADRAAYHVGVDRLELPRRARGGRRDVARHHGRRSPAAGTVGACVGGALGGARRRTGAHGPHRPRRSPDGGAPAGCRRRPHPGTARLVRRDVRAHPRPGGSAVAMNHWLMKNEPDDFGYEHLERAGRGGWDGVRNFQARNFLRRMEVGDLVLFYHSSVAPPGVAGIATIIGTAEPDPTQFDPTSPYYDATSTHEQPRWDWVTLAPVRRLRYVPLDELRTMPELAASRLLAKGNRLSVFPLGEAEFDAIVARADAPD